MRRKAPARKVEIRVRAPEAFTLIMVWPIMAQPPMPPKTPERMFAAPWPKASRVLTGVGVGDLIDQLGRHQGLEQTRRSPSPRAYGGDDKAEGLQA